MESLCRLGTHLLQDLAVDSNDAVTISDLITFDTEGISIFMSAIMNGLGDDLVPADDARSAESRDRVDKLIEQLGR